MVEKQKQSGEAGHSVLRQINEIQRMSLNELRRNGWIFSAAIQPTCQSSIWSVASRTGCRN